MHQGGLQPLLKVYDAHAEYTSTHRQKRPSTATLHVPIWHGDVRLLIQARTNHAHRTRPRLLFTCVWLPDILYVRRIFLALVE